MKQVRYYKYFKDYVALSYPLVFSGLVYILIPLADNLMVARLGIVPLAAASLANHIFTACSIFPRGVSYGLTPLITAAQLKQQYGKIAQLLKHALYINTALGMVFMGILLGCAWLLPWLQQDPEVSTLAGPYLQLIALSLMPMMLFNTLARYLEGLSCTKQLMVISLVGTLMNILLNYMLIYGKWGMPQLGLHGAGRATLLSRMLMMMLAGGYVFLSPQLKAYRAGFKLGKLMLPYFWKLAKLGIPIGLQLCLEMMLFALMAVMTGWMGPTAQAANAIVSNVVDIALGITWAISIATSILVSKPFTLRNPSMLQEVGMMGFLIGGFVATMLSLGFLGMYGPIFSCYSTDQGVVGIACSLVVVAVVFNLADSVYTIGMGALRGMQDTLHPVMMANANNWLVGLPIGYLLAFKLGWDTAGIWWGKTLAFSLSALSFFWRFYKKSNP